MSDELKPCPFCRSRDIIVDTNQQRDRRLPRIHAHCYVCGASAGHKLTKEEAIAAWDAWVLQNVDVDALRDDALSDVSFKATSDMVMEDVGFGAMAMFDHLAAQGYLTRVADDKTPSTVHNNDDAQGGHKEELEAHGMSITFQSDDCPLTQFRMMQDEQGDVWMSISSPEKGWQSVRLCTMQGGGKNLALRKALAQTIRKALGGE